MHKTRLRQQDGFVLYFYFLGVAALDCEPFPNGNQNSPWGEGGRAPLRGRGVRKKRNFLWRVKKCNKK